MSTHEAAPPSSRTTVKRGAKRAVYDLDRIHAILDAGMIAHVGVNTPDGPIVLPMVYGRRGDELLVHGGVANAMLRGGRSADVCITVTIVDGLVVARTPLRNSMNYRSVVIRGVAEVIQEPADKIAALRVINDHLAPMWDTAREPSETDVRITMVLTVSLEEASAKVRAGDPVDDPEDLDTPHWAGTVPLHTTWGDAEPAQNLAGSIAVPDALAGLRGQDAHRAS